MTSIIAQLLPVFAGLFVGYALFQRKIAARSDGDFLFKVCYYVCSPALSFSTLATTEITAHLMVYPLVSVVVFTACYLVGWVAGRRFGLSGVRRPTFLLACMIINSAFVIPFAQALYGDDGVARVMVFQVFNQFLTFGVAYAYAAHSNPEHDEAVGPKHVAVRNKLLLSPPLLGILAGFAVNLGGWTVPSALMNAATLFGGATVFVLVIATGILFNPVVSDLALAVKVIAIRLACGLAVGAAAVVAFDLTGMDRALILMLSLSPVAFNAVTFASMEKLDAPFAAGALSISLVVSLAIATGIALVFG